MTAVAGSVKVGRWHYPAVQDGETVTRNAKRDGSGEWEETNPTLFRPTGEGDPTAEAIAEEQASKARHPAGKGVGQKPNLTLVDGFTEDPALAAPNGTTHGGKVGAQTKKPGKSDWKVGSLCPQGLHKITDEDGDNEVYVMPSGRRQCRKCRRGYSSNKG